MNLIRRHQGLFLLILLLAVSSLACSLFTDGGADEPPRNAVVVRVVANASLQPWLETAVSNFNAADIKNTEGNPYFVILDTVESGQAVINLSQEDNYTLWIPEEQVWVNVLADQGNASYTNDCQSVAESPLVIAMWRSVAESLGWPGLPLGWLDIGSLAADQSAWRYYSGGEFGDTFRLGHTHPGLSGTGASTLLALVHAAQSKTNAVNSEDIQQPIVQASVGAFEGAVAWFSNNTNTLGATMSERGIQYLGAAVMYESTVVHYGNGNIVPVYPLEGTFVATFPACINESKTAEEQEGARRFREYLLSVEGQETAVRFGLRPVNEAVTPGPPLDEAHGVDLSQPEIIFAPPTLDSIYAVQELWQAARKDVNLVMLLDTSGSMRGDKIENMRNAAIQFVQQMGDEDFITLIAFSTEPEILAQHVQVGPNRDKIINAITNLHAEGDTTLYDAIGLGATIIGETNSVDTTNAMVVLTDGKDTRSYRYSFDSLLISMATANDTTVFTIAYGRDADNNVLQELATQANGNFYLGDEASIAAIYDEMSAAFGGSAGVGR
ncbi:MAG: VWA domain-containing protein [Chloroflexi bacterium]|nr:MAG: VWA domain-containing protein [Chloroflexota bacterium]